MSHKKVEKLGICMVIHRPGCRRTAEAAQSPYE